MMRNILAILLATTLFSCSQKKEFVFPEEGIEGAKVISGVNVGVRGLEENHGRPSEEHRARSRVAAPAFRRAADRTQPRKGLAQRLRRTVPVLQRLHAPFAGGGIAPQPVQPPPVDARPKIAVDV